VSRFSPNWAEGLVRFLTDPVVSSLLMAAGMVGIFLEIRTPGFGLPGALGTASLALFFWGASVPPPSMKMSVIPKVIETPKIARYPKTGPCRAYNPPG
jgi:membrane-bound ClpP family serine protease